MMQHVQDTSLVDYARGLVAPAEAARMQAHLRACESCAAMARVFGAVARVARGDDVSGPPDYVVHAARAIFALRQPEPVRFLSRLLPALTFDSFRDPQLVGVRSGQPLSRQMLYEAGPYSIDLRLDHDRGSRRVWLTGQVASDEAHPVDGLTVCLTAAGRVTRQVLTNSGGEFQFDYEPQPQLQLRIDVPSDQQIELSLNAPNDESKQAEPR